MGNAKSARQGQKGVTELQRALLERRRRLMEKLHQNKASISVRQAQEPGDEADVAVDSSDHELGLRIAEIRSREMLKVDEALQKIGNGTYGDCEWCGKKIPAARLLAMPAATLCVKCQQDLERGQSDDGASSNWEHITDAPKDDSVDRSLREFAQT